MNIGFAITDIATKFIKPLKLRENYYVITELKYTYKNYVKIYQSISSEIFNDGDLMCDKNVYSHACIRLCIINITNMLPANMENEIFNKLNLKNNQGI